MSGRVPSSSVAGSSAAGMPRAPTRTSRRALVGTGELGAWDSADDGHARTRVRIMTGRRTTGTRINLLIRGTSGICHPLRGGREEAESRRVLEIPSRLHVRFEHTPPAHGV